MKKRMSILMLVCCIACISLVFAMRRRQSIGAEKTVAYFQLQVIGFQTALHQLDTVLLTVDNKDSRTIAKALQSLRTARLRYKAIEFFVEYFFGHTANIYNRPAAYEVEAAGLEYDDPIGLQVIEALLTSRDPADKRVALQQQITALTASADDLPSLLYNLNPSDERVLESIQLELLRISTLGITGYDAPFLKTGITESAEVLKSISQVLQPYLAAASPNLADSLVHSLRAATHLLLTSPDFDSFDRLVFYKKGLTPLQHQLARLTRQLHLELNTTGTINYEVDNLFAPGFFDKKGFLPEKTLPVKATIELGKKLFFDKDLSANKLRSCATCHQPGKYFTDGLKTNTSLSGFTIRRNTPSLYYTVYQYAQFLDGRESSLTAQVQKVITNPVEMGGDPHNILQLVRRKPVYQQLFRQAFSDMDQPLSFETIARAIAAYETTLAPYNSAFDAYWAGNENSLSRQQRAGFNLFTGKAKCATCHFLPLFNGLAPPDYQATEFEILGVPASANFKKPMLDSDSGQFHTVPLPFTIGAFKTPTLRNIAVTAPYMHNGSLPTLEKVMDFYCKGGGQGIGIKMKYQTLPAQPLQLTPTEIKEVVLFLHSLTDKPVQ